MTFTREDRYLVLKRTDISEPVVRYKLDAKAIERAVVADARRPCLYGVAGPCFHPKCLNSHYETLRAIEAGRKE